MKKEEVSDLPLDGLRPLVQRGLRLDEWPGDWEAAGKIMTTHNVSFSQAPMNGYYSALVIGHFVSAEGHDKDPLVAIVRAYVLMRWAQAVWDKQKPKG